MKGLLYVFLSTILLSQNILAQDLNCTVTVDAESTGKTQLSIFRDLQRSTEVFLNETEWSKRSLNREEQIKCSLFITVHSYSDNKFGASPQIQSLRPIYGATIKSPIFNFKDNRFDFRYEENQPLRYNPNSFESNLVSLLSFYSFIILGLDADSFTPYGGREFFEMADQISVLAAQNGSAGWTSSGGNRSRYTLSKQLHSPNFEYFHQAFYLYHRKGLDYMHKDTKKGKNTIVEAINLLEKDNQIHSNSLLIRSFFDSKANEISSIFSGGPKIKVKGLKQKLNVLAPTFHNEWNKIE